LPLRLFVWFDRFFVRFFFYGAASASSPSAQNQHERDRRYYGQGAKKTQPHRLSVSGLGVLLGLLAPE
jgi:hypothetical protein